MLGFASIGGVPIGATPAGLISRISRVAVAGASAATMTLPAGRQIGDLEIMVAHKTSVTAPTVPAGWTTIGTISGNSNSAAWAYRWCAAQNDTSGTWTGATQLVCTVYRGVWAIGTHNAGTTGASTTVNFPANALVSGSGHSWFLGAAGLSTLTSMSAPTGMTQVAVQTSGSESLTVYDTNGADGVNWPSTNVTTATVNSASFVMELLDYSTLNSLDKNANLTLSNNNLTATVSGSPASSDNVRGSFPRASGKWVFSIVFNSANSSIGIANSSAALTGFPSADALSFFNSVGVAKWKLNGGSITTLGDGTAFPANTLGWLAVDLTGQLAWLKFVGGNWNNGGSNNPDTGVGGISFAGYTGPYYPEYGGTVTADAGTYNGANSNSGLTTFIPWDSGVFTFQSSVASPEVIGRVKTVGKNIMVPAQPRAITLGNAHQASSGSQPLVITTTAEATALGLIFLATSTGSAANVSSAVDSGGVNIYTALAQYTPGSARPNLRAFYVNDNADLPLGGTISTTFSNSTTSQFTVAAFLPATWNYGTPIQGGGSSFNNAGIPAVTVSGLDPTQTYLVFGWNEITSETTDTYAFPKGNGFSTIANAAQTPGVGILHLDYGIFSGVSSVVYNIILAGSRAGTINAVAFPITPQANSIVSAIANKISGGTTIVVSAATAEVVHALYTAAHFISTSINQSATVHALKAIFRTISVASAEVVNAFKTPSRLFSITDGQTVNDLKQIVKLISIGSNEVVNLLKSAGRLISVSSAEAVHVFQQKVKLSSISVSEAQVVNLARSIAKFISATSAESVNVLKAIVHFVHVAGAEVVNAIANKQTSGHSILVSVAQSEVVNLLRSIGKLISVGNLEVINLARSAGRNLSAVSSETVNLIRANTKALSVTSNEIVNYIQSKLTSISVASDETVSIVQTFFTNISVSTLLNQLVSAIALVVRPSEKAISVSQDQVVSSFVGTLKTISTALQQRVLFWFVRPPIPPTPTPTPIPPQFLGKAWWRSAHTPENTGGPKAPLPEYLGRSWWRKVHKTPNS